jgi:hypothetical protein
MEFKTGNYDQVLSMCAQASNMADGVGQTALFYAVQRPVDSEAAQVAQRLISEANMDPLRKDFGGQSPLFYAVACGNNETVKVLISQHNANANESDNLLQTPLFYAARDGRLELVKYLVDSKANPSHVDRNGQTPLFYAARENRREVVDFLLASGASPEHIDAAGRHASYFAKLAQHFALADHLDSLNQSVENNSTSGRKRYRMVVVGADGSHQTPTVEQLEWIESKFPEICVWSKTGPIATSIVQQPPPLSTVGGSNKRPKQSSSGGPKKSSQPDKPASLPPPVWMTVARQMVTEIFKKEDAWIFLRPVDPLRDMCADYLSVIKEPMDFSTIRKKMSKYQNKGEFLRDAGLVFSNCKTYNKPGTLPEVLGSRVELFWNELVDRYSFNQLPDTTPPLSQ